MATSLEQQIRRARRRYFANRFLNTLLAGWGAACLATVVWIQIQPWLTDALPGWHRWAVFGTLLGLTAAFAAVRTARRQPTIQKTALLIDERFGLRERVTTAISLDESLKETETGRAILRDATERMTSLKLAEKFPVELHRRSWLMPAPAAILAAIALLNEPFFSASQGETIDDSTIAKRDVQSDKSKAVDPPRNKLKAPDLTKRPKSDKLEKLEELANELDKLYANPEFQQKKMTPEKAREGMEKVADLQEKLKQMEAEKHEQIKRMQEQLQQLTEREKNEPLDGPGKEAMQALKSGDFAKAKEEFDKLKKKIKAGELSEEEAAKLKRQIADLAKKAREMAEKKSEQDKLKKMIDQAKKEGKNTESLEREMKRMEEDSKKLDDLKQLAKKLGEMKQAMDKNDLEEMAEKLGQFADQFGELSEDVKDLEELDESLEEIRKFRKALAGKGKGGEGGNNEEITETDDADWSPNGRPGAGRRKINDDAKSSSHEERVRTQFDQRGKKRYAGTADGPAFTKKSLVELEGEIAEAAQDVADSPDVQKLPKGSRDAVKEYMERLGGQKK